LIKATNGKLERRVKVIWRAEFFLAGQSGAWPANGPLQIRNVEFGME
jgi:hypothetical protein